ncbi:MAG TPA: CCA tRNA nucleotidyltransferase, partial [Actinoplanes sp.]|nr:CCA tRNA nucleotidyltransferase [Actinoplanes sp.]
MSVLNSAQKNAVSELLRVFPVADDLGRRFADAGHELHLVGGSVRDALLGRLADDLDFSTDAHPDQILAVVKGWADAIWETGREFGTIGVPKDGLRLEITTFRADTYDGVTRKPVVEYGTNLLDDLRRRDFTINAMAVSVPGHVFTDPYGGVADLAASMIRTPAAPEVSFSDDPLRMLRAARFAAKLRFTVDPAVVSAMTAMAPDLDRIAAERIRDEFTKLLCGADPVRGLRLLVDTGLADRFLPEISGLRLEIDEHAQHKDVYEHTLIVVSNAVRLEGDAGPDFVLRMAALMHDVGKPATKEVGRDGRVSFHHHEVVGARMTKQRMKALKYPKDVTADVVELVALHLRFYGYGRGEWTDSAVRRYVA